MLGNPFHKARQFHEGFYVTWGTVPFAYSLRMESPILFLLPISCLISVEHFDLRVCFLIYMYKLDLVISKYLCGSYILVIKNNM